MPFLNDRDIRRLCVTPEYVIEDNPHTRIRKAPSFAPWSAPYTESEQELITAHLDAAGYEDRSAWPANIQNFDPAKHPFEPMISNFVPNQVRYRATRIESQFRSSNPETVDTIDDLYDIFLVEGLGDPEGFTERRWYVKEQDEEYRAEKIISYGLTSGGYDVRLGTQFKLFTNIGGVIDPLNQKEQNFHEVNGNELIIPPNSYALGHTTELFNIPDDVIVICLGKSTYARAGLAVNVTPIEPGWEGTVVLELANQTPLPIKVYANQGIAQFMFGKMTGPAEVTYADRKGKYQGQRGVVIARG